MAAPKKKEDKTQNVGRMNCGGRFTIALIFLSLCKHTIIIEQPAEVHLVNNFVTTSYLKDDIVETVN